MFLADLVQPPTGHVNIKVYDKLGKLIDEIDGDNVIVNDGRIALAHWTGGDVGSSWLIDHIKYSDGGHDPSDPTQMLPVYVSDTDLHHTPIFSKALQSSDVSYPATNSRTVQFSSSMETSEGNGTSGTQAYSEVGLYYNHGTKLFAHKTFGYVIKNSSNRLVVTWSFIF